MKIMLVGSGAREHAIAKAVSRSKRQVELFAYLDVENPGITRMVAEYHIGSLSDISSLVSYAKRVRPNLVIFGPELPLALGAVDALESVGIKSFGPTRSQAQIEWDKAFMRSLMERYLRRGYPAWSIIRTAEEARKFFDIHPHAVVKPFGLTGGKGVKVLGQQLKTLQDAIAYANELISQYGGCVLEERVFGEEFSLMVFTDGKNVASMPVVQDYKYAYENDTGPMTGGMGSYSDSNHLLPFIAKKDFENALSIVVDTLSTLNKLTQTPYRGVLYGQFMNAEHGPVLIEFNARFGDPEAINVLALLETDFLDLCFSIVEGEMVEKIVFKHQATVCKYIVPLGYPDCPKIDTPVHIPESLLKSENPEIYFASVKEKNGVFVTTKSRTLALLGIATTPLEAKEIVDKTLFSWNPQGVYYRKDIPRLTRRRTAKGQN
ncbi:MAG: phosphoribosylamine--glycine ligase [Candidatus Bathyarchaeia archaeon]